MRAACYGAVRSWLCCWILLTGFAANAAAENSSPSLETIRSAVARSLPLLEAGSRGSLEKRKQCFTCHSQGVVILALTHARSRGFAIDRENLQRQLELTAGHLAKNTERYRQGRGQGGGPDTAGYALWALDAGGCQPDATTNAVTEYLLQYQRDADHWQPGVARPPTQNSPFTTSYLALRGLRKFGTGEQRQRIEDRFAQVRYWLEITQPQETEDRVFRLRALQIAGSPAAEVQSAVDDLLARQRNDGGWGQLDELDTDPYATSTALVALHEAGDVSVTTPAYRRGLQYLIAAQLDDGSWHVPSRARPIQVYFESGYPHGKDQFISVAAASWATMALSLALPTVPDEPHSTGENLDSP